MSQPIETSRRFVNTWECDENAHLNVQFYFWHFEDAHAHFWYEAGWPSSRKLPEIRGHHVRFHAELREGDLMLIRSNLAQTADGLVLCHLMFNAETDVLSATCWCPLTDAGIEGIIPDAPLTDLPESAASRSLSPNVIPLAERRAVEKAGFIPTFRSIVKPSDCNMHGSATTKSIAAYESDAAGHIWTHIGLEQSWLEENQFGRVAIESRILLLADIRPGTPLLIMTGLVGFAAKTITFRHHIYDISTNNQVAAGEITGLSIDLKARRATQWPENITDIFQSRLVQEINA